jgi:predicted nucleic acid-binding protein
VFLLDTNVLSERFKIKPHGAVLAWLATVPPGTTFISAMTVGEVQAGPERARIQHPLKAQAIETWLFEVVRDSQIVDMDAEIAQEWARMMHGKDRSLVADAWIAATAKCRHLTLATRNTRDFAGFGIDLFNPFEDTRQPDPTS